MTSGPVGAFESRARRTYADRVSTMRDWVRAATRPRLIGVFLLLALGAVGCIRLGAWQIDRAFERAQQAQAIEEAALANTGTVPLTDVVAPQTPLTVPMRGRSVEVVGTWAAELPSYFIAGRALAGVDGYLVLSPLREDATGALVPVVRGWVAEPDPGYLADLPSGTVVVVGYLEASEVATTAVVEHDTVEAVASAILANTWATPIYSGYLTAQEATPSAPAPHGLAAPAAMPPPNLTADAGVRLQNLAYAAEWFIFGGFALFLWWRMVRDEVRYRRGEAAAVAS